MNYTLRHSVIAVAIMFVVALVGWQVAQFNPKAAEAAAPFTLTGYAWSDTVGWISMSCTDGGPTKNNVCASSNYGVQIDSSKNLSGYAWSEYAGWIRFDGLGGGCPSGTCQARVIPDGVGGWEITGWARALAYTDPSPGGWDGWISLNCANSGGAACATSDYAIRISSTGNIASAAGPTGSFGWGGGTTIGWVDFGQTILNNTCSVTPSAPICVDPITSRVTTGDLWCGPSTTVDTDCSLTGEICDQVGGSPTEGTCVSGPPTVNTWTVTPVVVRSGDQVDVTWDTTATACTVSAAGGSFTAGGVDNWSFNPTNQAVVNLNCDGYDVASTTVNVIPSLYES